MNRIAEVIQVYHITDIENLPSIFQHGLHSDIGLGAYKHAVIGYPHIKLRRMTEYRVPCCGNAFVGQFVPFYFCPRSPMLFTVNAGLTGKPVGCQRTIVHLVSSVPVLQALGREWAVSDGNAGAALALFDNSERAFDCLDWGAIRATYWRAQTHKKQAEFLVRDHVPWSAFHTVGCYDQSAQAAVKALLQTQNHAPAVVVKPNWYYQ